MPAAKPDESRRHDVEPDSHLTYLIAKVEHQLQLRLARALQGEGVTLTQFYALAIVGRSPGITSADLARALLTTPQAVGTLVRRMEAAGLVERPEVARGLPGSIRLSKQGIRRLKAVGEVATAAEQEALSVVPAADRKRIQKILEALLTELD